MRAMLLVLVVVAGCTPRPCGETCTTGCCDSQGNCRPGTADGWCGANGDECRLCSSATCSPTGVCVPHAAGGGSGGGGGGGGGAEPTVSVLFRYDRATCCAAANCVCSDCQLVGCQVTKSMTRSRFEQLHSTTWSACPQAELTANSYDVNCSNNCTRTQTSCTPNGTTIADVSITCTQVPATSSSGCDWIP